MEFYDTDVIRRADVKAASELGISGLILMENAGRNCADVFLRHYGQSPACILVGPGNNGGDGLVMARHLLRTGNEVVIISSIPLESFKGDSATNLAILRHLEIQLFESANMADDEVEERLASMKVCVDALLGTGSTGAPRGECARLISLIPDDIPVLSVDIPSGIDPRTGDVYSPCVKASITVTMLASKTGLANMPAAACSGEIEIVDIGIASKNLICGLPRIKSVTREAVRAGLPERPCDLYKGRRGNVVAVGSSDEYRGALALTAVGALRTGAGLVFTVSSNSARDSIGQFLPESINYGFSFDDTSSSAVDIWKCLTFLKLKSQVVVIGPGLGRSSFARELVYKLWTEFDDIPLVVDADALYFLAGSSKDINNLRRRENVVLTPHEGEAARLLDVDVSYVGTNRLESVRRLASRWGTVLLKGPRTLIDDGTRTAVVLEGNPSLAVPGSGDVLSGIISAIMAGGTGCFESACFGAWIHGKAGDEMANTVGVDGILARELADEVPAVINSLRTVAIA